MKLKELIEKVDRSDPCNDLDHINEEFDMYGVGWDDTGKLSSHHISAWICTDSWVGDRVYFLGDDPVCISHQPGRKCSEVFKWISDEAYKDVYAHLLSLQEKDNNSPSAYCDLEEEWGTGITVEFSGQLLTFDVKYIPTGEQVKVTNDFREEDIISQNVEIEFKNGDKKVVGIQKVEMPYRLKGLPDEN
jgi:hypothetical protein